MTFNGSEGSLIEMQEGAEMTARYREAHPDNNLCVFFGKEILTQLMAQPTAEGLRFYFAINDDDKMSLVIVATDASGKDIQAKVGDRGTACPDHCCTDSPLSGNMVG